MKYLFSLIFAYLPFQLFAAGQIRLPGLTVPENASIIKSTTGANWGLVEVLSYIEKILLQVVLPVVVVGVFLYVAFELLTADGNEEKMKKAWKVMTFSVVGLITIALAYAVIAMASRLSL